MGFGPISSYPISDMRAGTFFVRVQMQAVLNSYIGSALAEIQAENWKRMILAAEINALTSSSPALTTFYAASDFFITRSTDTPANTAFDGSLETQLRVDRSIQSADGYLGFNQNISELSLINSDGLYDAFAGFVSVNGQQIRFAVGQTDDSGKIIVPYAQFELTALFTAERFTVSRQHLVIQMQDPALTIVNESVQNTYGGTGGLDGNIELSGKRKPFLDGQVFNVTPTLVIPNELLYQLNDGGLTSITAVKDGGVALTNIGNFANVAALRAAETTIGAGNYATSLSDGYFALGGIPFKQVTADAVGLHTATTDIIAAVAATVAGGPSLDQASFDSLKARQSATAGYFLDSNATETCAELFTKLLTGIGGWWGITPLGSLHVDRFEPPDSFQTIALYNTTGGDILDIDRVALPDGVDPPPHRRRAIYQRNWTVMTDLFGQVISDTPQLADQLRNPYSLATTSDTDGATVLALYPDAPDPAPIESYFAFYADALVEANRIFQLYSQGRSAFSFQLKNQLFVHQIGDVVQVMSDRLGLQSGKYLRLVSVNDDCSTMQTEVVGFG